MRRTACLLLAMIACACGPAAPAGAPAAQAAFDPAWLDPLDLPDVSTKPLVEVQPLPGGGIYSNDDRPAPRSTYDSDRRTVGFLLADDDVQFTVYDGLETMTYRLGEEYEYQPLDGERAARLIAGTSGRFAALKAAVIAAMLRRGGRGKLADAVLRRLAAGPTTFEARVREEILEVVLTRAILRYSEGGPRADLERALQRATTAKGIVAAKVAARLLDAMKAPPPELPAATPLDLLVAARVTRLIDARCTDETGPDGGGNTPLYELRWLGLTAVPALERMKSDPRPTRCLTYHYDENAICSITPEVCRYASGAPDIPDLATVGQLAQRELSRLSFNNKQPDLTDIECDVESPNIDDMARRFIETALADGGPRMAAEAMKPARGRLRVLSVEKIAKAGAGAAAAVLAEEARSGPVLLARLRAAQALSDQGDAAPLAGLAPMISGALRAEDEESKRCDHNQIVETGLASLLRVAPAVALHTFSSDFPGYGPRAKVEVLRRLRSIKTTGTSADKARDALFATALSDARAVKGMRLSWGTYTSDRGSSMKVCNNPSPSDIAAVYFSERLGWIYDCAMTAEEKAGAVASIRAKLGGD